MLQTVHSMGSSPMCMDTLWRGEATMTNQDKEKDAVESTSVQGQVQRYNEFAAKHQKSLRATAALPRSLLPGKYVVAPHVALDGAICQNHAAKHRSAPSIGPGRTSAPCNHRKSCRRLNLEASFCKCNPHEIQQVNQCGQKLICIRGQDGDIARSSLQMIMSSSMPTIREMKSVWPFCWR